MVEIKYLETISFAICIVKLISSDVIFC